MYVLTGIVVVDQLNQILYILGTPDDTTLNRIGSERVRYLIIHHCHVTVLTPL